MHLWLCFCLKENMDYIPAGSRGEGKKRWFGIQFNTSHKERDCTYPSGHAQVMGTLMVCWEMFSVGWCLLGTTVLPIPREGFSGLSSAPEVGIQLCKSDVRAEGRTRPSYKDERG